MFFRFIIKKKKKKVFWYDVKVKIVFYYLVFSDYLVANKGLKITLTFFLLFNVKGIMSQFLILSSFLTLK